MKLLADRPYLYQWELNQKIEVPAGCSVVHYHNGTTDTTLAVEVTDGTADIPNILLQSAADLYCYAWNEGTVLGQLVIRVVARPKPAEYAYTQTEVLEYATLVNEELPKRSQGRSAKYNFTTPGWKRVLNIIRGSGGMINFGLAQGYPRYMCQSLGVVFSGFVKYQEDTSTDKKPTVYQLYNNVFGEDDALENPGRITQIRISYPKQGTEYPNSDGAVKDYSNTPVNCYVDVYVDFDKDTLGNTQEIAFNINYSGFADSHNCEAITVETDAAATGIYGEELEDYTLVLKDNGGLYMPDDDFIASAIHADILKATLIKTNNIPSFVRVAGASGVISIPSALRSSTDPGKYGLWLNGTGTNLLIAAATEKDIDTASNPYKPIVPTTAKYAVEKYAAEPIQTAIKNLVPPLIVVYNEQDGSVSHASTEIFEAVCNGKVVRLDYAYEQMHINLNYCNAYYASFVKISDDRQLEEWVVDEDGEIEYFDHGYIVNKGQLDNVASGIQEEIDVIEEKQNELIAESQKTYELIEEITLDEDVASVYRTKDPDGNAYNFSGVRIYVVTPAASAASNLIFRCGTASDSWRMYHNQSSAISTIKMVTHFKCANDCGRVDYCCVTTSTSGSAHVMARANYLAKDWENINLLELTATAIPAGTTIKIWAIRG